MSEKRDDVEPVLAQALEAMPMPTARAPFKDELRSLFVRGAVDEATLRRAGDSDFDQDDVAETPVVAGPSLAWRVGIGLAVAAGLAAIVLLGPSSSDKVDWSSVGGDGLVHVGDKRVSPKDRGAFESALREGRSIYSEGGTLYLELGDLAFVEVAPSTQLLLREVGDTIALHTDQGGIRVSTGPGFEGLLMRVTTPHTEVQVTGTIFAVDITPDGTCVCCMKGDVCLPRDDMPCMIEPRQAILAGATTVSDPMPMPEDHARQLEEFENRARTHWAR